MAKSLISRLKNQFKSLYLRRVHLTALIFFLLLAAFLRAGTNIWTSIGPLGGSVNTLAIDPQNTSTIYVGIDRDIYKSTDGGTNWIKRSPTGDVGINYILIDPKNSMNLFAGGSKLFKSSDGGESWNLIYDYWNMNSFALIELAIDPNNSQIIYASGDMIGDPRNITFIKSINGGISWESLGLSSPLTFVIDPLDSSIIYVGVESGGVYKSINGGLVWKTARAGLPSGYKVDELAIDPINTSIIYAGTAQQGIYKSIDGGLKWFQVLSGTITEEISSIAIDPINTSVIYAVSGRRIIKSMDGGSSWHEINHNFISDSVGDYGSPLIVIDPKSSHNVYLRSPIGVYLSINGGVDWNLKNKGITKYLSIGAITYDQQIPPAIYAWSYSNNSAIGVFKSIDGGMNWQFGVSGLPTNVAPYYVAINPSNASHVCILSGSEIFMTIDGGIYWNKSSTHIPDKGIVAFDTNNSNTMYIGTNGYGVYKSVDGGNNWYAANSWLTNKHIVALDIDPMNTNIIYAGTSLDSHVSYLT